MNPKFLLSLIILLNSCRLYSQIPQGFNYQAVARDVDGKEISNSALQAKVSVLSDTSGFYLDGGSYIWEEQQAVITNNYGLFNLVIGDPSATWIKGSVLVFNAINWNATPLYIGIKIQYSGTWKNMGATRLWSVPYSMVAGNLSGAVKKLAVNGETTDMEEALFEVKNKNGQTVFAVYNEGVRIYVEDGSSKGTKGGFAIGGFDRVKGTSQNYLVVNSDSIRAYIDTNPAKALKGGFAIGGFDKAKATNEEYLRVTRDSTRIYLNDTETKARKGGFAIGGFEKAKGTGKDYVVIRPDSTNFYVRTISPVASSSFNILGVEQNLTQKSLMTANVDTISISGVLSVQNNLIVSGNIDIGGTVNSITDIDGNIYKTVTIGTQVWMKENLKTSKYNDGTSIPLVTDVIAWQAFSTPAYSWFDNDKATYGATYGAIYNWQTINTGKLCPSGWHVPTDTEWTVLSDFLGGNAVAGGKMKETGTTHWGPSNSGATNESGFTAISSGVRYTDGTFSPIGGYAYFWSSTSPVSPSANGWNLWYGNANLVWNSYDERYGLSVRCLKNN